MQKTNTIRNWSPKRPGYWKLYHQSQEHDMLEVFKAICWLVDRFGPPWKVSPLGRPPKILPQEYTSLCVFKKWYNLSYRHVEAMAPLLIGKRVDHSSIGWAMQRISPEYLDELVYDLYLYMDSILKGGLYITDSTGFTCDRYEKRDIKMKETKGNQTVKLHVAVKYYPRYGVTAIVTGTVSHGTAHDSPFFPYLIRRLYGPALIFCDRGYDSEDNRRRAYNRRLIPLIKERKNCGNSLIRIKARKDFNETLYKNFRGMVEGVFGGMETGYNNRTRCRLHKTRQTDVMLLAVLQNLKA
jgi:hypothetical protein